MECDYEDESWQETYKSLGCEVPYEGADDAEEPGLDEDGFDEEYPGPTPLDRENPLEPDLTMASPMGMGIFEHPMAFAGR